MKYLVSIVILITLCVSAGCSTTKTVAGPSPVSQVASEQSTQKASYNPVDELTAADPAKPLTVQQKNEERILKTIWNVGGLIGGLLFTFGAF